MERTTKIRITTTRKRTIHFSVSGHGSFCADCDGEVLILTGRDGADPVEMSHPQLEELVALGQAHAIDTSSGSLRVCCNSLPKDRSETS